ncbi:MAG: 2-C-methyl-D-erythritol 4-phosphate cytidylyltransferase [Oscillospiraceae bacterium]|nr:2-C-methyl-D-erythritol 4-phosphate cytidylyltransferase [Oscillospiraceae bacterium]
MNLFRRRNVQRQTGCAAVVAAAGESRRMGADKLTLSLRGQPVILHTLWALERCPEITEIVVVTREELLVPLSQLCGDAGLTKLTRLVRGGPTRTHSVQLGVQEVSDRVELIAVQDGARPLASQWMLSQVIQQAALCGAAAPALPVKDTIKRAANGVVLETPERSQLYAVQTPQVFQADLLRAALQAAIEDGAAVTDDCSAVERLGMKVILTQGAEENIKLTTPADLAVAEALMQWRDEHEDRTGI